MIRKAEECRKEYREHMRGGEGTIEFTHFLESNAELNDKGRLFSKITVKPGCSIGYHVHEDDSELFYILKGTGTYSDNGKEETVTAGDATICPAGCGHGLVNHSDEAIELIAVIVYA